MAQFLFNKGYGSPEMGKKLKAAKQGKKVGGIEGKETVQALLKYIMLCLDVHCTFIHDLDGEVSQK